VGGGNSETLSGLAGDDWLGGGAGNDFLIGGPGDDLLIGGLGEDQLTGGADDDTFKLTELDVTDLITDYGNGGDVLDLTDLFEKDAGIDLDQYVDYNPGTGELHIDASGSGTFNATPEADIQAFGGGQPLSVTIIFNDDGTDSTPTVI